MAKTTSSDFIVFKATFEAVSNTQQELRRHIELLITDNRPLKDEAEKTLFLNELSHSTLGLGTFKSFTIVADGVFHCGDVESIARWLAGQTSNKVSLPGESGKRDSPILDIKDVWSRLLYLLFFVFPFALDKAIGMSKESESRHGLKDSFAVGGRHGSG